MHLDSNSLKLGIVVISDTTDGWERNLNERDQFSLPSPRTVLISNCIRATLITPMSFECFIDSRCDKVCNFGAGK